MKKDNFEDYYDYKKKLEQIIEWSKSVTVKTFDPSFCHSVMSYYDERNEFTLRQEDAIDNIFQRWNVQEYIAKRRTTKKYLLPNSLSLSPFSAFDRRVPQTVDFYFAKKTKAQH